jgi:ribosomal protein S1
MQGRLHKFNNWGNELPEVGTQIQAIVIGSEDSDLLLGAISPRNLDRVFFAYPKSKDKWNEFFTQHNEGDIVEVQVLLWLESNMCYMVATSSGVVGTLPPSEIDWMYHSREDQSQLLKPGDIFNAVILKIHPTKSRAIFSKKALIKNPIIEGWSHLDPNLVIQAIVVNVMDYGYFVELQPSGIQALLHKTKVPTGKTFIKGQVLSLLIDVIDQEKNRISVKCPDDSLN